MLRKTNLCFLLVILVLASSSLALTGKIGNPRAVVYAEVTPSKPALISRTLDVINVNEVPVSISMDVSSNCTEIIRISDKESTFILPPDQNKKVPYVIKVTEPGLYDCKINTYFKEQDLSGPGIALASALIISVKGEGSGINPEENIPEDTEEIPNDGEVDEEITDGVSVIPGGATPKAESGNNTNLFAILFFVLMLIVVILLAVLIARKRRV